MKITYEIKLKAKEKKKLEELTRKGSENARKLTRCRILLLTDEGVGKKEVATALSINPKTVGNVCRRYKNEGLDSAINEKPRPGAPTIFDGKFKAKLTALACSEPPKGHGKWSLRLLADKAVELEFIDSISHTDVGRILKKTK